MQPILMNGRWTAASNPSNDFQSVDPSRRERIYDRSFPVCTWEDLSALVEAGAQAATVLEECEGCRIAKFLDNYAYGIEAQADALAREAHRETGLPVLPRLVEVEIPRTANQLRLAAKCARDENWRRPTIDSKLGIRSQHESLGGPVLVMGPNNFPFAFNGIAGGDFAAAIAAGNPVIAKAHPSHPYTTQLLGEIALRALDEADLPRASVQMFYHTSNELGLKLIAHPALAAVAFTGGRDAGMAVKKAADSAGKPVYLEMSSVNPVFVLQGALRERAQAIAAELSGACLLGAGQFCTKPGLVVVQESHVARGFINVLREQFEGGAPGVLLNKAGEESVKRSVECLTNAGADILCGGNSPNLDHYAIEPTLLCVDGSTFLARPDALQTEAFGAVCLIVMAQDEEQILKIAEAISGNLTACIYSHSGTADDAFYERLFPLARRRAGRLLNDKVPTGVAVSSAMNHGGPYPASGHPGFTAVGLPASIGRFTALRCYDNVREVRLPRALRNKNPSSSLWRLVDDEWSMGDVSTK